VLDFLLAPEGAAFGLGGLFLLSFLAATLLPGGSEAALVAFILAHPEQTPMAFVLATTGNTLGGMSTYAMGRLLPQKVGAGGTADSLKHLKYRVALQRHGTLLLLLAWTPVVGDALCAAAGWLRLPWLPSALWMALGKGLRYAVLIGGMAASL
jgi:membrane protein YqaA with SNARE-associated domain